MLEHKDKKIYKEMNVHEVTQAVYSGLVHKQGDQKEVKKMLQVLY